MSFEENKKQLERFSKLTAIVAAISAIIFVSSKYLSSDGTTSCPEGKELMKINPPVSPERFECR